MRKLIHKGIDLAHIASLEGRPKLVFTESYEYANTLMTCNTPDVFTIGSDFDDITEIGLWARHFKNNHRYCSLIICPGLYPYSFEIDDHLGELTSKYDNVTILNDSSITIDGVTYAGSWAHSQTPLVMREAQHRWLEDISQEHESCPFHVISNL